MITTSKRCNTIEELGLSIQQEVNNGVTSFAVEKWCDHFTLSFRFKTEKNEWNGRCICGHLHNEHNPTSSINYSAGVCSVGECRCRNFIHDSRNNLEQLK